MGRGYCSSYPDSLCASDVRASVACGSVVSRRQERRLEWELSRVVQPNHAKRLLLGIMLAIWCAVLLGEAAMRAGEIPASGPAEAFGSGWCGKPVQAAPEQTDRVLTATVANTR